MTATAAARVRDETIWHDVECGSYSADLELWDRLAEDAGGPVLDIGCGTGRVALRLARHGHDLTGLDAEPALVDELLRRARAEGLPVRGERQDARAFTVASDFALAIAPMQVTQLLRGADGRRAMLRCASRHLRPGGMFAAALADPFDGAPPAELRPPLPDVLERDGWVYSSTPVAVYADGRSATTIERLRQAVSPAGEIAESVAQLRLDAVSPDELEAAAREVGLDVGARRAVPATDDYVGSIVVVATRP